MIFAINLKTERLQLRPILWRDYLFVHRLLADAEVRRFLGGPLPWKERHVRFRGYLKGPANVGIWIVTLRSNRTGIGVVILAPHHDDTDFEVSYMFRKRNWGDGLATEAVTCVVDHAVREAGLSHVIAETQSANRASCRLLHRLNMVEIKRFERFGAEQIIYSTP